MSDKDDKELHGICLLCAFLKPVSLQMSFHSSPGIGSYICLVCLTKLKKVLNKFA